MVLIKLNSNNIGEVIVSIENKIKILNIQMIVIIIIKRYFFYNDNGKLLRNIFHFFSL